MPETAGNLTCLGLAGGRVSELLCANRARSRLTFSNGANWRAAREVWEAWMLLLLLPCVLDEFKPQPLCPATKTHIGQCFSFGWLQHQPLLFGKHLGLTERGLGEMILAKVLTPATMDSGIAPLLELLASHSKVRCEILAATLPREQHDESMRPQRDTEGPLPSFDAPLGIRMADVLNLGTKGWGHGPRACHRYGCC